MLSPFVGPCPACEGHFFALIGSTHLAGQFHLGKPLGYLPHDNLAIS